MIKRRLTKEFKMMGMRLKKDDLIIATKDEIMVIYTDDNSLKSICVTVSLKERYCTPLEIETYLTTIRDNSIEDNLV